MPQPKGGNAWTGKPLLAHTCVVCGSAFQSVSTTRKYCGQPCYQRQFAADGRRKKYKYPAKPYDPEKARAAYARRSPTAIANEKEAQRRHVTKIREFLNAYKAEHGCVDCGYNANVLALQFDHVGLKNRDVSRCRSIKEALAEIALCEVRCANCHHIKTHERRMNGFGNLGGRPTPKPTAPKVEQVSLLESSS